jgi:hypothetical protein
MEKVLPIDLRFPEWEKLSKDEQRVFELLEKLDDDNPWCNEIRKILEYKSLQKFRRLICELKSEAANGDELTMIKILGYRTWKEVREL